MSAFDTLTKGVTLPASADWSPRTPAIVGMGRDSRFLWPTLVTENAGTDTSIEDFRQTARVLTGSVEHAIDTTTDKASLASTIVLVTEAMRQHAVTIDDIPNALFDSVPKLTSFLGPEGQFAVEQSLDARTMAQIVAAAVPFGMTGTTIIEQVRNGIAAMRATGANPTVLVLNPTDAAALDLIADAGGFVFPLSASGSSSPLWGLRVVERIGAGNEPPYLLDPAMLGVLYLGQMQFAADQYSGFRRNLTTLRASRPTRCSTCATPTAPDASRAA